MYPHLMGPAGLQPKAHMGVGAKPLDHAVMGDRGFSLGRPASEITMKDVIEAIEGPIYLNLCLIAEGECSRDKVCPAHAIWEEAQGKMMEVLNRANFADLAKAERQLRISQA